MSGMAWGAAACSVRKLRRDDAQAWALLRREALAAHPLAFGASLPDDLGDLVEFVLSRMSSGEESVVFGAFAGEVLVGIAGILRYAGRKERHKAVLWGMYVAEASRRCGAGTMLLGAAVEQARAWPGILQVHLAVSEVADEARRMYERQGFQAWGRESRALGWDGRFVDEIHMMLDLSRSR